MASGDMSNYLEETELLIQLVRERPALYDRSRTDFKDQAYKQFMWQEVGDLMGCTSQEIHKKWIGLRDRYTAEHRKIKKNPAAAPSGWHFYDNMCFLEKQIIERRRILPYIYNSLSGVETVKKTNDVKIESFDSGVSGDSPWDGVVENSVTEEIDYEDNTGVDQVITPDVVTGITIGKRRRSVSSNASPTPSGRKVITQTVAATDSENADKLFGKMIGVMISELNDDDKDRAKIHIMSYLCTHGYKNNGSN